MPPRIGFGPKLRLCWRLAVFEKSRLLPLRDILCRRAIEDSPYFDGEVESVRALRARERKGFVICGFDEVLHAALQLGDLAGAEPHAMKESANVRM